MTSILADRQYDLDFFNNFEGTIKINELSDEVIQKINKLYSSTKG